MPLAAGSNAFVTFADLSTHLDRLGMFRIRPELGRLRAVLRTLAPASRPKATVQIAGTNGKGSTSTFLAALGTTHGLSVGLFTSPHFVSFRERIRINGLPVAEEALLYPANTIMAAGGDKLTYFEFVTVLAVLLFANLDLAVMETGLGGAWDAVTATHADAVAFTPIALDHCRILGDTIEAIATDKAGAIRPRKPVFSAPQPDDAVRVLARRAGEEGCPFTLTDPDRTLPENIRNGSMPLGLAGEHQRINAATALAVWRHIAAASGWRTTPQAELEALTTAFIPGRFQFVPASPKHGHPATLLDGAHNVHGMNALSKALAMTGTAPAAVIFACLEDKVPEDMISLLRIMATGPVFVPPIGHNPRAIPPEHLAKAIGLGAEPVRDMADALARAARHVADRMPHEAASSPRKHPVLICGSLYMLGEFFALRPECLVRQPPI